MLGLPGLAFRLLFGGDPGLLPFRLLQRFPLGGAAFRLLGLAFPTDGLKAFRLLSCRTFLFLPFPLFQALPFGDLFPTNLFGLFLGGDSGRRLLYLALLLNPAGLFRRPRDFGLACGLRLPLGLRLHLDQVPRTTA